MRKWNKECMFESHEKFMCVTQAKNVCVPQEKSCVICGKYPTWKNMCLAQDCFNSVMQVFSQCIADHETSLAPKMMQAMKKRPV